jgi:predicted SPOUT superfamily RNA methylase MTH1
MTYYFHKRNILLQIIAIVLDNSMEMNIGLERMIKLRRIDPGDTLRVNILLNNAEIVKSISYSAFTVSIFLGYIFDISKNLKTNLADGKSIEMNSGTAYMSMKRVNIDCGPIALVRYSD